MTHFKKHPHHNRLSSNVSCVESPDPFHNQAWSTWRIHFCQATQHQDQSHTYHIKNDVDRPGLEDADLGMFAEKKDTTWHNGKSPYRGPPVYDMTLCSLRK